MSRPDKLKTDILARLSTASRDLSLFTEPTPDQKAAKARFWAPFMRGEGEVPASIDLATALRLGADKRLSTWWGIPGFIDWFTNQEEFRERVEFIAHLALDGIEEVLKDRMATSSAKVAAAKLALEVAGKIPKAAGSDGELADKHISAMDKQQLESFIRSRMARLVPVNQKELTVDVEADIIPTSADHKSD